MTVVIKALMGSRMHWQAVNQAGMH